MPPIQLTYWDLRTLGIRGKKMQCPKCGKIGIRKVSRRRNPGPSVIYHGGIVSEIGGAITYDTCTIAAEESTSAEA